MLKGDTSVKFPLKFVRVEPYVIPKRSLTGQNTERIDTRVLQAIYALEPTDQPLYVGQQVEVYIDRESKSDQRRPVTSSAAVRYDGAGGDLNAQWSARVPLPMPVLVVLSVERFTGGASRTGANLHSYRVPMDVQSLDKVESFTTKDGSQIRELLAHRNSCILNQSLAEARVAPGATTVLHYHCRTEEIYYVLAGRGRMRLGQELREIGPGDAVAIPPGDVHQITNIGSEELVFLCCCTGLRAR